jgi:hypothetical protein
MKITLKKLKELNACQEARDAFSGKWGNSVDSVVLLKSLRDRDNFEWANWLIKRIMNRKRYLAYAIFSAEQVLDIYEKKYPDNNQPRLAMEAAKEVLKKDTAKNRAAAGEAAWAAGEAARAAMRLKILNYGIELLEDPMTYLIALIAGLALDYGCYRLALVLGRFLNKRNTRKEVEHGN